jgi:hypothetical protein
MSTQAVTSPNGALGLRDIEGKAFAIGDELSAIRCGDVSQSSAEICCAAIIKS